MAPIRPQCSRIVMSFNKESAYGTAVLDANINKLYEPNEALLLELAQERIDDADTIKGHEFPVVSALDIITGQNITVPLNFPSSCSVLGLLWALALGNVAVAGISPDFTHTLKMVDACVNDQLPSTSWMLGLVGDTASKFRVKGVVINELKLAMQGLSRFALTGSALSDGNFDLSTVAFPATSSHADWLTGSMADFLLGNSGGALTSQKTILRSFEIGVNNNLDVADGRGNPADATKFLKALRLGNRSISVQVVVDGHQGDARWTDFTAETMKDVQITLTKSAARSFDFRVKNCKVMSIAQSFDGIRDVLTINYKAFFTAADASPIVVIVKSGDAAYLV